MRAPVTPAGFSKRGLNSGRVHRGARCAHVHGLLALDVDSVPARGGIVRIGRELYGALSPALGVRLDAVPGWTLGVSSAPTA